MVVRLTSTAVQGRHIHPAGARVTNCNIISSLYKPGIFQGLVREGRAQFSHFINSILMGLFMDLNTRAHSISPLYLSNFWFVVSSLRTEERNRGLLLPHLLAAHAAPLRLPDLTTRHLTTTLQATWVTFSPLPPSLRLVLIFLSYQKVQC